MPQTCVKWGLLTTNPNRICGDHYFAAAPRFTAASWSDWEIYCFLHDAMQYAENVCQDSEANAILERLRDGFYVEHDLVAEQRCMDECAIGRLLIAGYPADEQSERALPAKPVIDA